MLTVLFYCTNI